MGNRYFEEEHPILAFILGMSFLVVAFIALCACMSVQNKDEKKERGKRSKNKYITNNIVATTHNYGVHGTVYTQRSNYTSIYQSVCDEIKHNDMTIMLGKRIGYLSNIWLPYLYIIDHNTRCIYVYNRDMVQIGKTISDYSHFSLPEGRFNFLYGGTNEPWTRKANWLEYKYKWERLLNQYPDYTITG